MARQMRFSQSLRYQIIALDRTLTFDLTVANTCEKRNKSMDWIKYKSGMLVLTPHYMLCVWLDSSSEQKNNQINMDTTICPWENELIMCPKTYTATSFNITEPSSH